MVDIMYNHFPKKRCYHFLSFMGGVDDFQTFMDVVDHFQSPKDYRDDLYSLNRVDLFWLGMDDVDYFWSSYIIEIIFNCLEKDQLCKSFSFSQCP